MRTRRGDGLMHNWNLLKQANLREDPGHVHEDGYWLFFLVVLLVLSRIVMSGVTGYMADDAFTTFRYASNLVEGHGFTYNPGEVCLGTSAPLFAILLAGAGSLVGVGAIPGVALALGILADALSLVMLWQLLGSSSRAIQFVTCSLFALFPKSVFISTLGMEAPLVVLGMVWMLRAFQRGQAGWMTVIAVVLLMVRIDTLLWSIVVLVAVRFSHRSQSWGPVVLAGGLLAGFLAITVLLWGSPIPWSVEAKGVAWTHLYPAFDPIRIILSLVPFHDMQAGSIRGVMLVALLVPLLAGGVVLARRRDSLLAVPVFLVLYLAVFAFGRTLMNDWYLAPAYMAYFVTVGWCFAMPRLDALVHRPDRTLRPWFRWSILGALIVFVAIGAARWRENPGGWFKGEQVRVGDWLASNSKPGDSVMLEPIGYIGWRSHLYVHDIIGLVSPGVTAYRRSTPGSDRWFFRYVRDHEPTYIVLQKWEIPTNRLFLGHGDGPFASAAEQQWFMQRYERCSTGEAASQQREELFDVFRHVRLAEKESQ
jgi:hypothetical protein